MESSTLGADTGRLSWQPCGAIECGRVQVPIYQGGAEYSIIRQNKETLGQRRIELDVQRDTVRASVVQAWATLQATKAQIIAAQAQVTAQMTTWAVTILNDPTAYPMFSTAMMTFGTQLVMARVEWHPPDFQNCAIHRGVTLYVTG